MLPRKTVAPVARVDSGLLYGVEVALTAARIQQIVLVSAATADLFRRSKAAPAVWQFIPEGDCHLTVLTLVSPRGPSQRGLDTIRRRRSVPVTSRPSDSSSNFESNGLPSSMIVR
jgi:hypothetical protein